MRSSSKLALLLSIVLTAVLLSPPAGAAEWWFETLDGKGSAWGGTTNGVGIYTSTVDYGGPHVWYLDLITSDLRHAWWDGSTWNFEILDGAGGPNGRVNGKILGAVSATVYAGHPHVWYGYVPATPPSANVVRHAWWTGSAWHFETLDGLGGPNGRIFGDMTVMPESASLYQGLPHIWYSQGATRLRHGWWTGSTWQFETLDGSGGPNGRTPHDVTGPMTSVLYSGLPHVFYFDAVDQSLRHGWWTGWTWMFEVLDGKNGVWGGTNNFLGNAATSVPYGGLPHVFYWDAKDGDLRHAWWSGATWYFEALDGWAGPDGRTTHNVGREASAGLHAGKPRVWYRDDNENDLRFAWWNGVKWQFVSLDGTGGANGRTTASVGYGNTNTLFGGNPHVFYTALDTFSLRHAWFG